MPDPTTPRYALGKEIARGGMGRVVEATDTLLGRTVAVKEALATDGEALRRFRREIRITARLEHPSIVPVHDTGVSPDGSPFYVMRRVSGRPLEQLVATGETLGERLALIPHVLAAAQAVGHAHRRGVIHRDIKPSNVLVGDLGETVVIDWGLAKVIDEPDDDVPAQLPAIDAGSSLRTRVGTVFGTPGFMPAEQLRGEPVDARSDVYALGATLYFVLARRSPHTAESETAMMLAAAEAAPPPLTSVVSGVPSELSTIVDKALAFDAAARYRDAGELAEDLQRFLAGQLVAAHHYSAFERFMRFLRKHRISVAIATIAVVTLASGGILAVRKIVAERDRADAQARATEERSEQLLLDQARTLVATNPTAAVASLKQLESPERWSRLWRRARNVAAGARANGVVVALKGPDYPLVTRIMPNGTRAFVYAADNSLWLYDLVARTSTVLQVGFRASVVAAGNDHVACFANRRLVVIDLPAGTRHETTVDATITDFEATATWLLWTDDHALWRRPVAGGAPIALPVPWALTGGETLSTSGDGHYLAVSGTGGLALYDLTVPAPEPKLLASRAVTFARWGDEATSLGVLFEDKHVLSAISIDGSIVEPDVEVVEAFAIPQPVGRDLFAITSDRGIFAIHHHKLIPFRFDVVDQGAGLHVASHGRLVALSGSRLIVMHGEQGIELASPIEGLLRLDARPQSPYVVGVAYGHVLVWNLDEVTPYPSAITATTCLMIDARNIVTAISGDWAWIDRDQRDAEPLAWLPIMSDAISWNARHSLLFVSDGRAVLVTRRDGHATNTMLGTGYATGRITDDDHAIFGRTTGEVLDLDLATRRETTLRAERTKLTALAVAGSWVVVMSGHGALWRLDRRTGATMTLHLPDAADGVIALAADGRAIIASTHYLSVWRPNGLIGVFVALPAPIATLRVVNGLAIVGTTDGTYVFDLDTRALTTSLPAGTWAATGESDIATYRTANHSLGLVDLRTGDLWPLTHVGNIGASAASISNDGTAVCSIEGSSLFIWDLTIPQTAEATRAWLDTLTNATAELGTASLTWH